MIGRRIDDRGGGLARVDGRPRILEGLALPREEQEFDLSYYNTLTNWVNIDALLTVFGLSRADLSDAAKVTAAVNRLAAPPGQPWLADPLSSTIAVRLASPVAPAYAIASWLEPSSSSASPSST